MAQKVTVTPLSDITSIMVGTTAPWYWEVETVYVSGVSTAFTWTDGLVSIPSYTTGTVLVEFTLFLLYDAPSQYFPRDPTDSGSDPVYWENRLSAFISYATSIRSFETGLTDISVGNVSIQIDDDWLGLIQQVTIFSNRTVRIYRDDVIAFKGISTRSSISNFVMTINVQKRITILDSECSWGDPAYLNRIDRTSSNAFYTGSTIPDQFEGFAIPMVFGDETPYDQSTIAEIDLGTPNPLAFVALTTTKARGKGLQTSSSVLRVIPTSSTTGIIGRMPAYQTVNSTPINLALTGQTRLYGRFEQANNATILNKMIQGEVCILENYVPGKILSANYYNKKTNAPIRAHFNLADNDVDWTTYDNIQSCNEDQHFFPTAIPSPNWVSPAITTASPSLTPGGHRWLKITVTGMNLLTDDLFVVLTNISGAITAVEVMQFALESHGFTVDTASFAAMAAEFPYDALIQCGFGTNVPTLGQFVSEINRSLMTTLVFPASNDVPYLVKIDPSKAASQTIDESQIDGLTWTNEYRDQAKNVIFRPKYERNDQAKNALYSNITSSRADLFGSERTVEIDHILSALPGTRFEEMTEIYGSPITQVKLGLLDEDVAIELADVIEVDHTEFKNKILITNIEQLPIGRNIQGRYLYVN
jgi:hypothetical protein